MFDRESILRSAKMKKEIYPMLRFGQSVYIITQKLYPEIVNKYNGSKFDCFYDDKMINKFLNKVEKDLKRN